MQKLQQERMSPIFEVLRIMSIPSLKCCKYGQIKQFHFQVVSKKLSSLINGVQLEHEN